MYTLKFETGPNIPALKFMSKEAMNYQGAPYILFRKPDKELLFKTSNIHAQVSMCITKQHHKKKLTDTAKILLKHQLISPPPNVGKRTFTTPISIIRCNLKVEVPDNSTTC